MSSNIGAMVPLARPLGNSSRVCLPIEHKSHGFVRVIEGKPFGRCFLDKYLKLLRFRYPYLLYQRSDKFASPCTTFTDPTSFASSGKSMRCYVYSCNLGTGKSISDCTFSSRDFNIVTRSRQLTHT